MPPGARLGPRKIASIGVHASRWVTTHGYALNVDLDPAPFTRVDHRLRARGRAVHVDGAELGSPVTVAEVRPAAAAALAEVFDLELEELPAEDGAGLWRPADPRRRSATRRIGLALDCRDGDVAARRRAAAPAAVDEGPRAERGRPATATSASSSTARASSPSARRRAARTSRSAGAAAPRRSRSSATRAPAPAATATSTRGSPRPARPARAAPARAGGGDDGPRRTSSSRRSTATTCPTAARGISRRRSARSRRSCPECSVEVLTPDFLGVEEEALATVIGARPEVFNHNIETVRRLHRADARREGELRRGALAAPPREGDRRLSRADEVGDHRRARRDERRGRRDACATCARNGVDVVTIGQYLQPSSKHATIDRWVHPDEFRWLREQGEALGFGSVFAGPARPLELPRRRAAARGRTGRGAVAY